ncbi:hypothetical protein BJV78DRAFT_1203996 [Lactifluus subvellereus]|nr:hypothetical protein BJV78DRAFT_1203996 [Lactifluus subvellereus]
MIVLHAIVLYWDHLLFVVSWVLTLTPLEALSTWYNTRLLASLGFFIMTLGGFVGVAAPKRWRIWNRMWVWPPVRRFFRKYGSAYLENGRYSKPTSVHVPRKYLSLIQYVKSY